MQEERRNDEVMLTHLKYIAKTADEIKADIKELQADNKLQWGELSEHSGKIIALETLANMPKPKGFNYRNLKYIIPATLTFLGGIVAIILKYAK